jgi:hypothetical protein
MPTAQPRSNFERRGCRGIGTSALPVVTWREVSYDAINTKSSADHDARVRAMSPTAMARMHGHQEMGGKFGSELLLVGEKNWIGQHVPERYLDDHEDLKGTHLKVLCRVGALPVVSHVGREQELPGQGRPAPVQANV